MNADEWAISKLLERQGSSLKEYEAKAGYKISSLTPADRHGLMRRLEKDIRKKDKRPKGATKRKL